MEAFIYILHIENGESLPFVGNIKEIPGIDCLETIIEFSVRVCNEFSYKFFIPMNKRNINFFHDYVSN